MAETAEQIATRIGAAIDEGIWPYFDCLAELWADSVEIRHVGTGAYRRSTRDELLAKERGEFEAVQRIVPDFHQEEIEITVEENRIRLHEVMVGTLPDGTSVRTPCVMLWTIVDGQIAEELVDYDLEAAAKFHALIKAAGLPVPEQSPVA